jgi:hypothetical protein
VLAHGTVDNIVVASPLPAAMISLPAAAQVALLSDTNWFYTLEATTNFVSWSVAAPTVPGNGGTLTLQDTNPPATAAFYRVSAALP